MIEIRKYSNRRLYDTSTSQYVTLADVAQMIRDGVELRVVDAKSSEDLTRVVMLQIICESKAEQEALPINFLRSVIQASSKTVQTSIKDFLSAGMSAQKEMAHWVRLGAMANPLVAPFVAAWEGRSKNGHEKATNGQAAAEKKAAPPANGSAMHAELRERAAGGALAVSEAAVSYGTSSKDAGPGEVVGPEARAAVPEAERDQEIDLLQMQLEAMQQQIEALRKKSS